MKMRDYRLLTQEQKIMMVNRDFTQVSRDLARYNRLAKYSGLLAEAYREVNGWWNRPVNRSKEDYVLAQACVDLQEAKRGNDSAIKGAREILAALLVPVQEDMELAMQRKAGGATLPTRGNSDEARKFWEDHADWTVRSPSSRQEQLDAVALFWDNGKAEDMLVNAAGQGKSNTAVQDELYKQTHFLRSAFDGLGVESHDFDNHAVGLRAFYAHHGRVLSQMSGKSELEKMHALNQEKIRLAEQRVWDKSLESLRPEGRMRTFKSNADYARNKSTDEDVHTLPPIVSLRQEIKSSMQNTLVGKTISAIWANPKKKRAALVTTSVGVLAVAGYVAAKSLDEKETSKKGSAPKESFQDRIKNTVRNALSDAEEFEPDYEDEDALRADSGQAIVLETTDENNPFLKSNDTTDNALARDSLHHAEQDGLFEPDVDASSRSVIDILVKEDDRNKMQKPEVLNMLKQKLEENQEDVNAPRMALEQPPKDQKLGGSKQKYTPN